MPERIGEYRCTDTLGRGAFSKVFRGVHMPTGLGVAIKVMDKEHFPADKMERELGLCKLLNHPFCCSFYEFIEDEKYYYLVMELVDGGSLFSLVTRRGVPPEWRIRHIFCELISALDYLHEELHIAHRDLKLENIILDRYGNIRLIDFGLGNAFRDDECLETACGSPSYAPPEMLRGQTYTVAADVWSAGVLLYALSVGRLPFEDKNINKMVLKIIQEEPNYPETLPPLLADLIRRMLIKDPKFRIRIEKIKEHPWFKMAVNPELWSGEFGLQQGFRTRGFSVNPVVARVLQKGGLDMNAAIASMQENKFDSAAACYRIVHRNLVSDAMSGLSEKAEDASKNQPIMLNQRGMYRRSNNNFALTPHVIRRPSTNAPVTDRPVIPTGTVPASCPGATVPIQAPVPIPCPLPSKHSASPGPNGEKPLLTQAHSPTMRAAYQIMARRTSMSTRQRPTLCTTPL